MFSAEFLADPGIKANFNRALDLMNHAVSGTHLPGMRENVAYFTSSERRYGIISHAETALWPDFTPFCSLAGKLHRSCQQRLESFYRQFLLDTLTVMFCWYNAYHCITLFTLMLLLYSLLLDVACFVHILHAVGFLAAQCSVCTCIGQLQGCCWKNGKGQPVVFCIKCASSLSLSVSLSPLLLSLCPLISPFCKAEDNGILFVPASGNKRYEGKALYTFGKTTIYIDRGVVFALKNKQWMPVSLETLVEIASWSLASLSCHSVS